MAIFDRSAGPMPEFAPTPSTLETSFGTLRFSGGGFPDAETVQKLYDELDLQRATQAYLDLYPAVSILGILAGQARDLGARTSSDVCIFADRMKSGALYLTGNTDSVYATMTIDLSEEGPVVAEIPAGMYGPLDDAYFKWLIDFSEGRHLLLPPGYEGDVPDGYIVVRSPSNRVWAMVRGAPALVGTGDAALEWYRENLKVYPLETGPREGDYINITGMKVNTMVPEDGSFFEWLDEIIQAEPAEVFGAEHLGRLASLGIEKGKPFAPDERMRGILDQGAKLGSAMARATIYANRDESVRYWPDRLWEVPLSGGSDFMVNEHLDADARTFWHFQAIVVTPAMAGVHEGKGSAYLTVCRDSKGEYLDGAKSYRLRFPPDPPAEQFWSITLYDPATRCLLETQPYPAISSLAGPIASEDGSFTIHFGPEEPAEPANWVRTDPERGWLAMVRLYGPKRSYIDKSWVLDDIVEA